jgi:hypothetical protein
MASSVRQVRGFRIAAICFFLAGGLWCFAALIGGKGGAFVALGMMNVCIGAMFLALSRRKPTGEDKQQTTGQIGPDGVAKPN